MLKKEKKLFQLCSSVINNLIVKFVTTMFLHLAKGVTKKTILKGNNIKVTLFVMQFNKTILRHFLIMTQTCHRWNLTVIVKKCQLNTQMPICQDLYSLTTVKTKCDIIIFALNACLTISTIKNTFCVQCVLLFS